MSLKSFIQNMNFKQCLEWKCIKLFLCCTKSNEEENFTLLQEEYNNYFDLDVRFDPLLKTTTVIPHKSNLTK